MRAGIIAVLDRVACPIDARSLAIPHRKYAVDSWVFDLLELLGAPDCGCGQVFVDPRLKDDLGFIQSFLG